MRTYVYPADDQGCGLHRLIWPALTLRGRGHHITIVDPKDRSRYLQGKLNMSGRLVDVVVPDDAEVIVLQRITHRHLVDAIPMMRDRDIAVVIDMDDDLAAIDPHNPAFLAMHPRNSKNSDHSWHFAQLACEAATYVTVSTPALLARYAPHNRGEVLFNCIPQRYLKMEHTDSTTVGWAGSVHSHPTDLQVTGTAIGQVTTEINPFHMIGSPEGARDALRLSYDPPGTGPLDPKVGWPKGVNSLGIGIAPLAPTKFNQSKSWLKPLEYAALGVPCVMSPSPEYKRIHELGVGVLAAKPRQWVRHLRELIENADARAELARRGREVATNWTIEGNAERWVEAWENARQIEQKVSTV